MNLIGGLDCRGLDTVEVPLYYGDTGQQLPLVWVPENWLCPQKQALFPFDLIAPQEKIFRPSQQCRLLEGALGYIMNEKTDGFIDFWTLAELSMKSVFFASRVSGA